MGFAGSQIEYGNWTPSLLFGGGGTGITYINQLGTYARCGSNVILTALIIISSKGSSTGTAVISSIPYFFQALANISQVVTILTQNMTLTSGSQTLLRLDAGNNSATFLQNTPTAASATVLTDANFTNTTRITFGFRCIVDI